MRFRPIAFVGSVLVACLILTGTSTRAQRAGMFQGSADDPAIKYTSGPVSNVIDDLNKRLDAGAAKLTFQGRGGYLKSALDAIGLPADSQMLLYSKASLQGRRVSETNPRGIFFNDHAQLGWVRDADVIEVAAQDATQGVVFYTLQQKEVEAPRFKRVTLCLGCHMTGDTSGVPGLLMFSTLPETEHQVSSIIYTNHSMPIAKRFGGWFVTAALPPAAHQGNVVEALQGRPRTLTTTEGLYDAEGYVSQSSDIAPLMVFAHQAQTVNLMTRAGWEARVAPPGSEAIIAPVLRAVADDVVDALLFIDEAKLDNRVQGISGFAERFAAEGPKDKKGRSLRQLDLTTRLMRYPCSYLIYSPMFDNLPPMIKTRVYERMWQVLSGAEKDPRYRNALSLADRQAIVEILRDTKPGLPSYFKPVLK